MTYVRSWTDFNVRTKREKNWREKKRWKNTLNVWKYTKLSIGNGWIFHGHPVHIWSPITTICLYLKNEQQQQKTIKCIRSLQFFSSFFFSSMENIVLNAQSNNVIAFRFMKIIQHEYIQCLITTERKYYLYIYIWKEPITVCRGKLIFNVENKQKFIAWNSFCLGFL